MKSNNNLTSNPKKTTFFGIRSAILAVAAILMLAMPVSADDFEEGEIPFDEAQLYFELNNTDGDLGFHGLIDGEAWKRLNIEDPNERNILRANVRGRLGRQGLTEFFFESAEPTFDELSPERFFRRFPEGTYEIEGITLEGEELEGEVWVSHVMPAPAVIKVNGVDAAPDCEEENEHLFPVVKPNNSVIISWDKVEWSHPNEDGGGAGVQPPVEISVLNYEVVVEIDDTEPTWKSSIILTPDQTAFEVPPEVLDNAVDGEVKFEVLVRAENYNQTAVESCFVIDED
jgi:hypothetical protein